MARRIESHLLEGPAGRLEALLEEPEDREPVEACLVCHPHPLYGGTLHNKVVFRMARALRQSGAVVLRFNFRGVGRSQGSYGNGVGELEDARAALEWLQSRYPGLGHSLAGFSFGSRIILRLGCGTAARRLIAAGFPTQRGDVRYLAACTTPKVFIQSTHDEHGPRLELERLFAGFSEPKRLYWVEAQDHFFSDALDQLEERVRLVGDGVAELPLDAAAGAHTDQVGDPGQ
ncbi:MAG: alpha/beta hydrolase [Acidobacteria bacterium]|nr:alpha/beta hydrolase [Acidobacteriota bacterium]